MNNTQVTLDQLAEIAGGPHYTTWNGYVTSKKINPQWQEICDADTSFKSFTTGAGGDSFKQQQYSFRSENRF